MAARWSPEELAILARIWRSPTPVKLQMHLLPGRSESTAGHQAIRQELGAKNRADSKLVDDIEKLLKDGRSRTVSAIFKEIDISLSHARNMLNRLVAERRAHIADWEQVPSNGLWQAIYVIGRGVSMPRPKKMTQKERSARFERKIDPLELQIRRQRYTLRQKKNIVRRDPLIAAFFGEAA
jgi:hypothetical protein